MNEEKKKEEEKKEKKEKNRRGELLQLEQLMRYSSFGRRALPCG